MDSNSSSSAAVEERAFVVDSAGGRRVHGRVTAPRGATGAPVLFALHGFRAHMDWGFFPDFARRAAARGWCVVRFSFSGSGVPPGADAIVDREAFAADSYGKQLEDLEAVHAALDAGAVAEADPTRWALVGHSRGSGVGLIHVVERGDALGFVGWAQITTPGSWSDAKKRAWREAGSLRIPHGTDGGTLELGTATLDDLEAQRARYDLLARAAELTTPALFLHGDRDIAISAEEARTVFDAAPPGLARFAVLERTGHTFGVRHPMTRVPDAYLALSTETLDFLDAARAGEPKDGGAS